MKRLLIMLRLLNTAIGSALHIPPLRGRAVGWEDLPMGRIVLNKLRSRKGASITFALLAFLVCAVVGAVLLASASAAAGRLSGLAESDQRYYAVTSAAQLFCDTLDGQSFTIERSFSKNTKQGKIYELAADGGPDIWVGSADDVVLPSEHSDYGNTIKTVFPPISESETEPEEHMYDVGSLISGTTNTSLLTKAALFYVYKTETESMSSDTWELAWGSADSSNNYADSSTGPSSSQIWGPLDVTVDGYPGLSVNVTMQLHVNDNITREYGPGAITFEFKNASGDPFTVMVILSASIQDDSMAPVKNTAYGLSTMTPINPETKRYTVNTTVTDTYTKTTTITWTVADVKKVS